MQWYIIFEENGIKRHMQVSSQAFGLWKRQNPDGWIVEKTSVGDMQVSTVFLGLDHNHSQIGLPVLYETIVFGKDLEGHDDIERRYCTWAEAQRGHDEIVMILETERTDLSEYFEEYLEELETI